jgi:hypothetical protein
VTEQRYDDVTGPGDELVDPGPVTKRKSRRRLALLAGATAVAVAGATGVVALVSAGPDVPDGWDARSFHGMTFAVPPGARMPDDIEEGEEPVFSWNGPSLGKEGAYALVSIMISESDGKVPARDRAGTVSIPGALGVRSGIGPTQFSSADMDGTILATMGGVQIYTNDAFVFVGVRLPAGKVGEQMADDLIASIDVTDLEP